MRKACLIIVYIISSFDLAAQISEGGISVNPTSTLTDNDLASRGAAPSFQVDTLTLPFWDDFSYAGKQPDTLRWQQSESVFINDVFSYLAPTINVATLDGLRASGSSYSNDTRETGYADELRSQPIDLSDFNANSNIFLSFFWQEGYQNQAPDDVDSLIVQFLDTAGVWVSQLQISGNNSFSPIPFQQEFIPLNDARYIHSAFQFRFIMYGNLAGNFDSWNIDYVYLNQGNLPVNTQDFAYDSYEDRSFTQNPGSLLHPYYSVPLQHITSDWLDDKIRDVPIIYQNLWAGNATNPNFGTEIFSVLKQTFPQQSFVDSLLVTGLFLTNNQDTALFNASLTNRQALVNTVLDAQNTTDSMSLQLILNLGDGDSLFYENVDGSRIYYPNYSFQSNDTISSLLSFSDYYALDDGTAESSIRLDSRNYLLAQEFIINGSHRITGIDLYIPAIAQNTENQNITLLVWDELTADANDVLIAQNILTPNNLGLNEFIRVNFDRPVSVNDTIYVGYREESDVPVSVGFDKNSNSAERLFVNTQGIWEKVNDIRGSIMIRPVFEEIDPTLSSTSTFSSKRDVFPYPNPFDDRILFTEPIDAFELVNAQGLLVKRKNALDIYEIETASLPKGLYILKILLDGQWEVHRVLKR